MKTPAGAASTRRSKSKPKSAAGKPRRPAARIKPAKPAAKAAPVKRAASAKGSSRPGDWRAETLDRMRTLILEAVPGITEERKWRKPSNGMAGVPVWSHDGIVCTGETYQNVVKLTFAHGATVPDPARLFNSSLAGGTRRAIDIAEGEKVDARAFKALVKAAAARNSLKKKR